MRKASEDKQTHLHLAAAIRHYYHRRGEPVPYVLVKQRKTESEGLRYYIWSSLSFTGYDRLS